MLLHFKFIWFDKNRKEGHDLIIVIGGLRFEISRNEKISDMGFIKICI